MIMSENKDTYKQLLAALEQSNINNTVDVFVPSVGREVKFTPLTIKHQKQIIATSLDNAVASITNHVILTGKILIDSCCEPDVQLYSMDRDPVLIGLRVKSLGYDANLQDEDGEKIKHNIETHVKSFSATPVESDLISLKTVEHAGITIRVKPPTMQDDIDVSTRMIHKLDSVDLSKKNNIKNTVSDALVYEYIKYIKRIEIGEMSIPFDYQYISKLIQVVESLPITISTQVLQLINKVKSLEEKFTKIDTSTGQLTIATDARFYDTE